MRQTKPAGSMGSVLVPDGPLARGRRSLTGPSAQDSAEQHLPGQRPERNKPMSVDLGERDGVREGPPQDTGDLKRNGQGRGKKKENTVAPRG